MIGHVYINNDRIGDVNFRVISQGHCVISGDLMPDDNYEKYRPAIRDHCERTGVSNVRDFNYRVLLPEAELQPQGGISITDHPDFDEIIADVYRIDRISLERVMTAAAHTKKHEIWQDRNGLKMLLMTEVPGFDIHKLTEPGSKLIHTFTASSHYDAMTIYYQHMKWGEYTSTFDSDKRLYDY